LRIFANGVYQDVSSGIGHDGTDFFSKDISIFHSGTTERFEFRRGILDSGSRGSRSNLITKRALKGIRCEIKKDAGRKIGGLGFKKRLREFVTLKFKFWDQPEIFEAEFCVLPTLTVFGFELGAPFDCLLGAEWMNAHPHAWIPRDWPEDARNNEEDGSRTE
jgi:hypothetical protein